METSKTKFLQSSDKFKSTSGFNIDSKEYKIVPKSQIKQVEPSKQATDSEIINSKSTQQSMDQGISDSQSEL